MPTDVIMPQMGESIFEGTITKWLKQPGEKVQRDEPLFEISTDKVDAEIPAPASGTLQDIKVQAGNTVQVNTVVGTIAEEGAAAPAPSATQPSKPAAGGDGSRSTQTDVAQPPSGEEPKAPPKPPAGLSADEKAGLLRQQQGKVEESSEAGDQERVRSSPLVRRIAKENNVDLTKVSGTGIGGRITKDDIEAFIVKHGAAAPTEAPSAPSAPAYAPPSAPAAPAPSMPAVTTPLQPVGGVTPGEIVPMSVMRKKIAEHMVMSKRTSAHVHGVFEVDVTRIVKLR
jgi:pyruvate dehydrogenase E2 component (dihydrolipoamide acetyltransferase)